MLVKMESPIGGGNSDWITPTYSNNNQTISCTWNYDADCIILIGDMGGYETVWYIPVDNNHKGYWATNGAYWQYDGTGNGITMTKRSFTLTKSYSFSNISIIPIPSKPTIYS